MMSILRNESGSLQWNRLWVLGLGFTTVALLFVLFMSAAWSDALKGKSISGSKLHNEGVSYVLVIDAGSSGTRMNAFTLTRKAKHHQSRKEYVKSMDSVPKLKQIPPDRAADKVPKRSTELRRAYKRVETEPGLATFSDAVSGIESTVLEPLLRWAEAVIPKRLWSNTPVFLFGTAGMRRLDKEQQRVLLKECRKILDSSGFLFKPEWARVIQGIDEGVYGWVALNAQKELLGSQKTMGALDLGGSSLEVTFDVGHGETVSKNDFVEVNLGGKLYRLHTQSIPHAGLDDAFQRSVSLLEPNKESQKDMPKIKHPCLHTGFKGVLDRIALDGNDPTWNKIELVGDPDDERCDKLAEDVVSALPPCKNGKSCTIMSTKPHQTAKFAALSGFFVVKHFYGLDKKSGVREIEKITDKFCSKPWSDVSKSHKGEMAVETYCFRGEYVHALLEKGLKLEDKELMLGYQSPGWPLGAALVEAQRALASVSDTFSLPGSSHTMQSLMFRTFLGIAGGAILSLGTSYILIRTWQHILLRNISDRVTKMSRKSSHKSASSRNLKNSSSFNSLEAGESQDMAFMGRLSGNGMSRSQTHKKLNSLSA